MRGVLPTRAENPSEILIAHGLGSNRLANPQRQRRDVANRSARRAGANIRRLLRHLQSSRAFLQCPLLCSVNVAPRTTASGLIGGAPGGPQLCDDLRQVADSHVETTVWRALPANASRAFRSSNMESATCRRCPQKLAGPPARLPISPRWSRRLRLPEQRTLARNARTDCRCRTAANVAPPAFVIVFGTSRRWRLRFG